MRKDFTLYPIREAKSTRTYIHDTGRSHDYHEKGIDLLQKFASGLSGPGQEILQLFRDFKKAMGQPQNLGKQKTGNKDVSETLSNILREIYGKDFDSLDDKIVEIASHLAGLEELTNKLVSLDVSQNIADLSKSHKQLKRERPAGIVDATPIIKSFSAPKENDLPYEGTPEWDRWVAKRASHIQSEKQKANERGDASKGDDLNGQDWWDHKAHWQKASDEIERYLASNGDDRFTWSKHYHDWRSEIGTAINEYYEIKSQKDDEFFKSILPPKPSRGFM